MEEHTEQAQFEEEAARLPVMTRFFLPSSPPIPTLTSCPQVKIAVYGSLVANLALCVLQSEFSKAVLSIAAYPRNSVCCHILCILVPLGYWYRFRL